MHKLAGCGLSNVWLTNGFKLRGEGETSAVSFTDLLGLFHSIARAVALTSGDMRGEELRFLRKRLNWTQQELATIVGKVDQAIAKWEKGATDIPLGDANLVRLAWLQRHSRKDLARAVKQMTTPQSAIACHAFVFTYEDGRWGQDEDAGRFLAVLDARKKMQAAVTEVMSISSGLPSDQIKLIAQSLPQGKMNEYVSTITS